MKLNSLGYSLASASLSIDKSPLGQPEGKARVRLPYQRVLQGGGVDIQYKAVRGACGLSSCF